MDTARMNAKFIVGSNSLTDKAKAQVLAPINAKYGGCTISNGQGCWSEDGAEDKTIYDGIRFENAWIVEVSAPLDVFDLSYLKECFIPCAPFAQWIHCETRRTDAHHFDVQALVA